MKSKKNLTCQQVHDLTNDVYLFILSNEDNFLEVLFLQRNISLIVSTYYDKKDFDVSLN